MYNLNGNNADLGRHASEVLVIQEEKSSKVNRNSQVQIGAEANVVRRTMVINLKM